MRAARGGGRRCGRRARIAPATRWAGDFRGRKGSNARTGPGGAGPGLAPSPRMHRSSWRGETRWIRGSAEPDALELLALREAVVPARLRLALAPAFLVGHDHERRGRRRAAHIVEGDHREVGGV